SWPCLRSSASSWAEITSAVSSRGCRMLRRSWLKPPASMARLSKRWARMSSLSARARARFAGAARCATNRRGEAREAALDHVVGRPAAQRLDRGFLADRAGNEDERGIGGVLAQDVERPMAAETGQGDVGKHDVGRERLQHGAERGLVV